MVNISVQIITLFIQILILNINICINDKKKCGYNRRACVSTSNNNNNNISIFIYLPCRPSAWGGEGRAPIGRKKPATRRYVNQLVYYKNTTSKVQGLDNNKYHKYLNNNI